MYIIPDAMSGCTTIRFKPRITGLSPDRMNTLLSLLKTAIKVPDSLPSKEIIRTISFLITRIPKWDTTTPTAGIKEDQVIARMETATLASPTITITTKRIIMIMLTPPGSADSIIRTAGVITTPSTPIYIGMITTPSHGA
jgi:hypothetical protein